MWAYQYCRALESSVLDSLNEKIESSKMEVKTHNYMAWVLSCQHASWLPLVNLVRTLYVYKLGRVMDVLWVLRANFLAKRHLEAQPKKQSKQDQSYVYFYFISFSSQSNAFFISCHSHHIWSQLIWKIYLLRIFGGVVLEGPREGFFTHLYA